MRHPILLTAAAVLLVGCDDGERIYEPIAVPQAAAGGGGGHNNSTPITFEAINPCNGDEILFSGWVNERFDVKFDPDGGFTLKIHANFQNLKGVAADGTEYRGNEVVNETLHVQPGSAEVHTLNISTRFVSKGKEPNFRVHFLEHITVNANGEVTSEFVKESTSCN